MKKFLKKLFIREKICAYCGRKLTWRFVWDIKIYLIWKHINNTIGFRPVIGTWPVNWRPEVKGVEHCSCVV